MIYLQVASKFGKLLKDLNILPSDHVTSVTGNSLQGQYVGETKEKVLKAMHQARGGILFIDEAYGMAGGQYGKACPYAKEAVDTLVGTITQPEFKGNMLVIMAGYEDPMDQMFASVNPGFASRFNKRRVHFLPWTAQQATDAVVADIKKADKTITQEATHHLLDCCCELQPLSSWGSARDVFESILPALYAKRAKRLVQRRNGCTNTCEGYEVEDVKSALAPIVKSRMKALEYANSQPERPPPDTHLMDSDEAGGREAPKVNIKHKIKILHDLSEEEDTTEDDIFVALEQACVELGYSEDDIVKMLRPCGDYTQELLARIVQITGCSDMANIRAVLDRQKHGLLARMEAIIEQRMRQKTKEEKKMQEKLKRIGRCPMEFEWLKVEGGWRCAGGSHFCTDAQIRAFCSDV
jgi:hypothetical protein